MVSLFPHLGPIGYIILLEIITMVFFGMLFVSDQLQSIDIKKIASQANQTANSTNVLISSGTNIEKVINEIRNVSVTAEESRQNLSRTFIPALNKSFVQQDTLVTLVKELNNTESKLNLLLNERTPIIMDIANQTGKLADATSNLTTLLPQVTESVTHLAENFGQDSSYLQRENQQYIQANETLPNINQTVNEIKETLRALNSTLSQ